MELTTLIVLLAVALVVMAIVVGALVVRLIHKNNELKEKNDVIVREVRRNQRLIDRAVQQGVSRAAMLSVALLCMVAQGAWAEGVNYIYYKAVDVGNHASLNKFNGTATDFTVLTSTLLENSSEDNLGTGWYVLNSTFSYGERIVISGNVNLILKDGCTLTAEQGIRINTDATLSIYAQSEEETTMGKLVAIETHHDKAAIGGNKNYQAGKLYIHGGNIEANCKSGSKYAAGIGGGYGDGSGMKEITIYSGKVTAQGAYLGAGIGGGKNNNHPGTINIYGGTVNASGGDYGAGIGGGENRAGWNTNVYSGNVTAQGGKFGAGIGGGEEGAGGNLHFYGGTVTATGGEHGAGIGGGSTRDGGNITIDGGEIRGICETSAAGIGGGKRASAGTITINGGTVWATGGGYYTTVSGGDDGDYEDDVYYIPAMMGCGGRSDEKATKEGTITIGNGATVHLRTTNQFEGGNARGIDCETLNLGSNLKVKAMKNFSTSYINATPAQRVNICLLKFISVDIEPCTNHTLDYTVTTETHTATCRYCEYTLSSEAHSYIGSNTQCTKCGYGTAADIRTLSFYQTATTSQADYMASGTPYVQGKTIGLPDCTQVPSGWEFVGWLRQNDTPSSIETVDGETLLLPGEEYTVDGSETFYARYRYVFTENWQWWIGAGSDQVAVTVNNGSGPQLVYATVTSKVVEATATTPGYTVYTATANYKPNGYTYTFTDEQTVVNYTTVELNEEDNTTTLETSDGLEAKAALTGRTLYKDGNWNTLCLPFDVADISSSPLEGATVKELTDASFANGTLTLTFADATGIKAGKPYLIKWNSGNNLGSDDLIFNGVTLTKDLYEDEISTDDNGTATVTFMGTYKKLSYDADDRSILLLGENNTLYYPQKGASLGAQRAYFKLSGITAGDKAAGVRSFVLDFGGDDGETTGIIETVANSSLFILHSSFKEGWHTLDGRKLAGKPAQKGLYINNGKKIVIK